jgi:hypothetical protein
LEEGGEAFGEVGSVRERRERGWRRWLFEAMAARWHGAKKMGEGRGACGCVRVKGEGGRERGPWHGDWKRGAAGSSP